MLWQHDPAQPIGVWDEVREDARGLYVKGRMLTEVARGREAAALIAAGPSTGCRSAIAPCGPPRPTRGRRLVELELWEVSLVTFPMLPEARVAAKGEDPAPQADLRALAAMFEAAPATWRRAEAHRPTVRRSTKMSNPRPRLGPGRVCPRPRN